jgi:hypothetical protein
MNNHNNCFKILINLLLVTPRNGNETIIKGDTQKWIEKLTTLQADLQKLYSDRSETICLFELDDKDRAAHLARRIALVKMEQEIETRWLDILSSQLTEYGKKVFHDALHENV